MRKTNVRMKEGDLFRLEKHVYRVMDNPEDRCGKCAAYLKEKLCLKLPDCGAGTSERVYFKRLNAYELRQGKKQNTNIQNL